ncbi:MAG: protein kinase [Proteobacteria bacterium]|nr:protein kinase [Pseudomonadota bacterium]
MSDSSGQSPRDDLAVGHPKGKTTNRALGNQTTELLSPGSDMGDRDEPVGHANVTIGRYAILKELGHGGMGTVYAAYDQKLHRRVALKLLHNQASDADRKRLEREARALARVSHRNVVQVYDTGTHHNQLFIAMELIDGQPLHQWLNEHPDRSWQAVLQVYLEAARGIAAAHQHGLIHRDIKPANVLIGEDGRVCVVDFGLARIHEPHTDTARSRDAGQECCGPEETSSSNLDGSSDELTEQLTQTGTVMGTPIFMAPEQIFETELDPATDQYCFCFSLYTSLYGKWPFAEAQSTDGIADLNLRKLRGDIEPPPPDSEVPQWLYPVIARGLAPNPKNRHGSMNQLIAALETNVTPRTRIRRSRGAFLLVIAGTLAGLLALSSIQQAELASREAVQIRARNLAIEREAVRARNAARMATAREQHADPTTVLALLREVEPLHTPRGWSTLALWALNSGVARAVFTQPDVVHRAAFSPDGRRIVAASFDMTARVWNADGSGTATVLRGHQGRLFTAAFSPDGSRIVTASFDKTARVWNSDGTGEPVVLRGHQGWVKSASFSPDGSRVVTASWDKTARIWNADGSGTPRVLLGHQGGLNWAAFSPDGSRIVTASFDNTVLVWNVDGSGSPTILKGHQKSVYGAVFSPDSSRIVTTSADKTVRIWNADGSGTPHVLVGHQDSVYEVAFSSDGTRVVTTSADRTVRVWNADGSGEPRILRGHRDTVFSASFSPDDTHIVTASADRTVRVWDADRSSPPRILRGHHDRVTSLAFSPDGQRIVTASFDATARVWNANGSGSPRILRGHHDMLYSAAFSPGGKRIITASYDHTVRVWDADGSDEPLIIRGHEDRVNSAAFSRDGTLMVTASADRTARVWSASGAPVLILGHDERVASAAFSPDNARIVTASQDRIVRVWNADGSGQPTALLGHQDTVHSAAFSPDGSRIVTASFDKTARVWNADGSGKSVLLLGHEDRVYSAVFSPDGARIVTASADNTVRVWNADGSGQPLIIRISDDDVTWAAFSPDGTRIAAAFGPTIQILTHFEPLNGPHDPKLWLATAYCIPIERRKHLLDVTDEMARFNLQTCQRRVNMAQLDSLPRPAMPQPRRSSQSSQ